MFVNTCGGDQNPLPRRSVELCRRYGHLLAAAVEDALKQTLKPVSPSLRTAFRYVDLAYLKVATREDLSAALRDSNAIRARWAARMLRKLEAGETFAASYPYPVHAWQLGEPVDEGLPRRLIDVLEIEHQRPRYSLVGFIEQHQPRALARQL